MASIDSTGPPRLAEYDVFLSFRGLDTRTTFADYLYHALKDAGIRVFRDDEELYKGKELASELPRAISNSRICIPIFSRNYANSAWCLREAAHMVECWEKAKGAVEIVPIFYDVDVSEVKLRSGSYKDDIEKHRTRFKEEIIDQWKKALVQMGRLKGWTLNDAKGQGELVKNIVKDLLNKLKIRYRNLPSKVVGLDNVVDELMKLIDVDSDGVKFIVIHGMGGIGKTTLAKVVFNRLVNSYEGGSFLDNVRESAKPREILDLQKKLLSDVFNKEIAKTIDDTDGGINRIRGQMKSKRVLIVLDNVDEKDQLQNLAGRSDWFGFGSRIIITTRNQGVLAGEGESDKFVFYDVKQMGYADALSLFSWHAFGKDDPPGDYEDLSREIVSAMVCLPLALEVIGSLLKQSGKCKTIWQETFEKLKRNPDKKIQDTMMISIEKLDIGQRQVFLDIACFLIDKDITNAIYMWKDCGYAPLNAIDFLVRMSLLKRIDDNKLWMHDVVRDVGREMIREKSSNDPERQSRVWDSQEAKDIIKGKRGTNVIEVLRLESDDDECTITHDATSTLQNLRFLRIPAANLKGDFRDHFPNLRWLEWYSVPPRFKVVNFHPRNLVVLDLHNSEFTENWGGWKQLKAARNLKVLNLTACKKLKKTPDFSSFLQLEKLILRYCSELAELDPSVGKLKHLTHLDMESCRSLRKLPEEIGSLDSLEYLSLAFCCELQEIPSSIGYLKSLVELDISGARELQQLPDSIGNIKTMKVIKMACITNLKKLPNTIFSLQNLEVMDAENCGQSLKVEFPKSLTGLSHLEQLHFEVPDEFEASQFPELPSSLKSLQIGSHSRLDFVPDLSYLTNLTNLDLRLTERRGEGQSWIIKLTKLEKMKIDSFSSLTLPQELANLSMLKDISLHFGELCLPGLPSQLETLELVSAYSRPPMETIPALKDIQMLHSLKIRSCRFSNMEGLCFLSNLRELSIEEDPIGVLDLSSLRNLKSLTIDSCNALVEIQGLGDRILLEKIYIQFCDSLEGIYDLSNLRNLNVLNVGFCPKLRGIQGIDQLPALLSLALFYCETLEVDTANLDILIVVITRCPKISPESRVKHGWYSKIMSCGCLSGVLEFFTRP